MTKMVCPSKVQIAVHCAVLTLNLVLFPNRKETKENVVGLFSSMCSLYHKSRELANLECSLAPFNMFQILNKSSARWINRTLPSDYAEE